MCIFIISLENQMLKDPAKKYHLQLRPNNAIIRIEQNYSCQRKWYSLEEDTIFMHKRKTGSFIILFLIVLLSGHSYAERHAIEDKGVIVRFDDSFQTSAIEVLKLYPGIRQELIRDLGWGTDSRPEIILVKDRAGFKAVAGSDLVTALAIPQDNLIMMDATKMNVYPFTLRVTLKHEMCHLALHHHIAHEKLPRWFDEGICQWVSGGLAEIMADGNRSVLREAFLSNSLISIDQLTDNFPSDGRAMILAYEESKSIVEYTEREFGVSGVRRILEHMSSGDNLEDSVQKSLSISLYELKKRWKSSLADKTLWVSFIGDNLYEILFLFAAVITVYGFIVVLKKRREYKDNDENDNDIE